MQPGVFELAEGTKLWLVDGQHRVCGLLEIAQRNPDLLDFDLPVIVMHEANRYAEAEQYLIINKTQKGVRADLAERILAEKARREGADRVALGTVETPLPASLARDIGWRSRAVEVCDAINRSPSSPLRGRIKLPNVPQRGATISQKSFCDSLKPVLEHEIIGNLTKEGLVGVLIRFWGAVAELCPGPFEEVENLGKAQDYLLLRTAGPFVLHRVLPALTLYCPRVTGRIQMTKEAFLRLLESAGDYMTSDFWRASGDGTIGILGSSQKSFALAADMIMSNIRSAQEPRAGAVAVELGDEPPPGRTAAGNLPADTGPVEDDEEEDIDSLGALRAETAAADTRSDRTSGRQIAMRARGDEYAQVLGRIEGETGLRVHSRNGSFGRHGYNLRDGEGNEGHITVATSRYHPMPRNYWWLGVALDHLEALSKVGGHVCLGLFDEKKTALQGTLVVPAADVLDWRRKEHTSESVNPSGKVDVKIVVYPLSGDYRLKNLSGVSIKRYVDAYGLLLGHSR